MPSEYWTPCAIWYYLHNLKNVKNTHGGVLLLVKLEAEACNCTTSKIKVTLLHGCFSRFLNCKNDTKLRKASHIMWSKYYLEHHLSRSEVVCTLTLTKLFTYQITKKL